MLSAAARVLPVLQLRSNLLRLRHQRHLRLLPVAYRHTALTAHDAFLVSYPKSGNTWLRFMLTDLLGGRRADFDADSTVVAEVGAHRTAPAVLPDGGRLIKSHEPYAGPHKRSYRKAIYLVRDGRDVAVSYYYTLIRRGRYEEGDFEPFLKSFLAGEIDGYGPWQQHVESWLGSPLLEDGSLLLVKYEDLLKEPVEQLSSVVEFLGKPLDRERIEAAVDAHSAERMRERERGSRFHEKQKRTDIMFVRTAGKGDWTRTFTAPDEELFRQAAGDQLERLGYT
jgi:hypothetical protein